MKFPGQDAVSRVGFDVLERRLSSGGIDLLSENRKAQRVAENSTVDSVVLGS